MNFKEQALNLFVNKTKYKVNDIRKCVQIHKGFTNVSYKVTLKDQSIYQIRIANDKKKVNRLNEQKIYRLIGFSYFVYYDVRTGNAIKHWIKGNNPNKKILYSNEFLKKFANSLKRLHSIKSKNILKHDYFDCINRAELPFNHKKTYLTLIKQYLNMPLVLSHNDLSADNLIYTDDKKVVFIDYEWARMNNRYWDVANFIREVELPPTKIKLLCKLMGITNIKKLLTFVYLATNYAYQWTFNMPLTKKIKEYRKISFKRMLYYYRLIQS